MRINKFLKNRKALAAPWEYILYFIVAVIFLVLMIVGYFYFTGTDTGAIAYVKNFLRFGVG